MRRESPNKLRAKWASVPGVIFPGDKPAPKVEILAAVKKSRARLEKEQAAERRAAREAERAAKLEQEAKRKAAYQEAKAAAARHRQEREERTRERLAIPPAYKTISELAKMVKLKDSTLRGLLTRCDCPCHRVSKRVLYREDIVRRIVDAWKAKKARRKAIKERIRAWRNEPVPGGYAFTDELAKRWGVHASALRLRLHYHKCPFVERVHNHAKSKAWHIETAERVYRKRSRILDAPPEGWYSGERVCFMLGVTRTSLSRYVAKGRIRAQSAYFPDARGNVREQELYNAEDVEAYRKRRGK